MNPAQKALWYIESHLADALTLDDIAGVAGSRASTWCARSPPRRGFRSCATCAPGVSPRRRGRWPAARRISSRLALEADYGSHEAFTRAFRDHFGVTPEVVRASTCLDQLKLQEPIVMDSTALDNLQAPRFETGKPFLVAGISERYTCETRRGHSRPVAALSPVGRSIFPAGSARWPTASAATATMSGNFDYIAGVEVSDFSDLPREFSRHPHSRRRNTRSSPTATTFRASAAPSTRSGITGCRHQG